MKKYDFSSLHKINSMIISGGTKDGKATFLFYLINYFYKEKVLIFTSQEKYLFDRKIDALSKQFSQFSNIRDMFDLFYLQDNFTNSKQRYGYSFFLEEIQNIILKKEQKIVVFHRLDDFFDFQDRYEIDNFYKSLVKFGQAHNKIIIFLTNNQNDNFEHIYQIAEEFSDMTIQISKNNNNERILNIMDLLHHKEYPKLKFKITQDNFILEYLNETTPELIQNSVKNILIAEIDKNQNNMTEIYSYICNTKNFNIKYANSLQGILKEIFIKPEVIILLIKRNQENLETIKAIKTQLPSTTIITILDQDFIRSEDMHEFFNYGSNEVFANNLSFDDIIVSLQKATKTLFYTNKLNSLSKHNNILKSVKELKELANECVEKSIFFNTFLIESKTDFPKIETTSRRTDYIYQTKNKLYYLAIDTMPKDLNVIASKLERSNPDLKFNCVWRPISKTPIEECAK